MAFGQKVKMMKKYSTVGKSKRKVQKFELCSSFQRSANACLLFKCICLVKVVTLADPKLENTHNSPLEAAMQLKQAPLDLSFHFL